MRRDGRRALASLLAAAAVAASGAALPDAGAVASTPAATPDAGAAPRRVITAEIIEKSSGGPCGRLLSAGRNQGVKEGARVRFVGPDAALFDTGVVERVFPNLSRAYPSGRSCRSAPYGAKAEIELE